MMAKCANQCAPAPAVRKMAWMMIGATGYTKYAKTKSGTYSSVS
jgi:hypothetical protein